MFYKCLFIAILLVSICKQMFSQVFTNLDYDNIFNYERIVYTDTNNFHTSIKPYLITEINKCNLIDTLFYKHTKYNTLNYILNKNIIELNSKNTKFVLNPIINLQYEQDDSLYYFNSYGLTFNANIKNKLCFVGNAIYNQVQFPDYFKQKILTSGIIPHFGKYDSYSDNTFSFFSYTGYASYNPSKYANLQVGVDKNFLGDGYRSLFLSDNSNANPFFKATLNLWKIKYLILFSALKDINSDFSNYNLYEKYSATHYLSYNTTKWLNLNIFETVIWRGGDSTGYRGYDMNYLNPFVVYRPVEYNLGSPDNILLGAGFKIKFLKSNNIYGQILLDEFNLTEIKKNNGWWATKYGYQFGIKCYNLFTIKNLYLQLETNVIRPYTYSHENSMENYGSYYQPLAHPIGANLNESVINIRYSIKRISISFRSIYTIYGADTANKNFGQNNYLSYTTRYQEYGNKIGQGVKTDLMNNELKLAYIINPKLNMQFEVGFRERVCKSIIYNKENIYLFARFKTCLYNTDIE